MNIQDLASLIAARSWSMASDRAIRLQKAQTSALISRGAYVGYDADREVHQVRLANGDIVEGRSITNAGWAAGDEISISGVGGDRVFKTTPR